MNIINPEIKKIKDRVEQMAIDNDYSRVNLELQLVCNYVLELEHKLKLEKEEKNKWKQRVINLESRK